jgi:hypothetical protein
MTLIRIAPEHSHVFRLQGHKRLKCQLESRSAQVPRKNGERHDRTVERADLSQF